MKAHRKIRKGNKPSNLIITPMIDIVFQLVLFLLVSTTFSVKPAINLNLPKSETAQGTENYELIISVSANGEFFFNKEKISENHLALALDVFDSKYPVAIEADDSVPNGTIVKIFDELGKKGFTEVYLRTRENQ